jgi:hypothetical protein
MQGLVDFYPELYENAGTFTQHEINFGKKWGSYATIIELAGGNIKEIDNVVKEPLEKCLLFLAFRADKNYLQEIMHQEALRK